MAYNCMTFCVWASVNKFWVSNYTRHCYTQCHFHSLLNYGGKVVKTTAMPCVAHQIKSTQSALCVGETRSSLLTRVLSVG